MLTVLHRPTPMTDHQAITHQASDQQCPGCGRSSMFNFFELTSAPVHCNVLWPTRDEALRAPAASIRLAYCRHCGLIYNVAFDQRLVQYEVTYENALHFSPRFRQYARELADRLVSRYRIREKNVIDVGCGDGDFLAMLCQQGSNRGVGFDPGHNPEHAARAETGTMTIIAEPYTAAHADRPVDLLTCRHVLEHIADPQAFLVELRRNLEQQKDAVVYFEVPNALYTLRDRGVWDIIYEHCSYFTAASLTRLLRRAGFDVLGVTDEYGGQFLGIDARPGEPSRSSHRPDNFDAADAENERLVARFSEHYERKRAYWRRKILEVSERRRQAVVWGAGSKGVTFLNTLNASHRLIGLVVDVNPRKHDRFVPRTAQRVVAPERLRPQPPDYVIVMNPIYRDEVARMLTAMDVNAELLAA